jgi:hypothetical protein
MRKIRDWGATKLFCSGGVQRVQSAAYVDMKGERSMDDTVERLRSRADYEDFGGEIDEVIERMRQDLSDLLRQAATEIETLRKRW